MWQVAQPTASKVALPARIASAARSVPVREGVAAFGEVGLTGRLRPATQGQRRADECRKLGLVPFEAAAHRVPCLWAPGTSLSELLPDEAAGIVPWNDAQTAEAGVNSPSWHGTVSRPAGVIPRPSGLRMPLASTSARWPSGEIRTSPWLAEAV